MSKLSPDVFGKFCTICLRTEAQLDPDEYFETHDIIPKHLGGKDELVNYMVVCNTCHDIIHKRQRAITAFHDIADNLNHDMRCDLQALISDAGIDFN